MTENRFKLHTNNDEDWITDNKGRFNEIDLMSDCGEQIEYILNNLENERKCWKEKALHKDLASMGKLSEKIDELIQKYRNSMTEDPSTTNHYCNTFIKDMKQLKKEMQE